MASLPREVTAEPAGAGPNSRGDVDGPPPVADGELAPSSQPSSQPSSLPSGAPSVSTAPPSAPSESKPDVAMMGARPRDTPPDQLQDTAQDGDGAAGEAMMESDAEEMLPKMGIASADEEDDSQRRTSPAPVHPPAVRSGADGLTPEEAKRGLDDASDSDVKESYPSKRQKSEDGDANENGEILEEAQLCGAIPSTDGPTADAPEEVFMEDASGSSAIERQCFLCMATLHFRSERSAATGYKMHVMRCRGGEGKLKEALQDTELAVMSEERGKASPAKQVPPLVAQSNIPFYSIEPNPNIPGHLAAKMRKTKLQVRPPDLRPVFGCTWCGPLQKNKTSETLCPLCLPLKEEGWKRIVCKLADKKVYFNECDKRFPSVRAFLEESTKLVGETLEGMATEDQEALLGQLHVVELKGTKDRPHSPKKRPRPVRARESANQSTKKAVGKEVAEIEADSTPPRKRPPPAEEEESGVTTDDAFISLFSKTVTSKPMVSSEAMLSSLQKTILQKRIQYVSDADPRPAPGCEWCGVTKTSNSEHPGLCPVCQILRENGWSNRTFVTNKLFCSPNGGRFKGVKDFLVGSTDLVSEAMRKLSPKNRSKLQAKYKFTPVGKDPPSATSKSSGGGKKKPRLTKKPKSSGSGISSKGKEKPNARAARRVEKPTTIELPAISQLLEKKGGLSEVLEADVFQVYNTFHGTNANVAAKILLGLGKGQLPSSISEETPLLRSEKEMKELQPQSSRFVGVYRVKKTATDGKEDISFGVAVPQFYVNCGWSTSIERTQKGSIVPKTATVSGRPLLIRMGIDDEDVAGKLFSFCYRILYGSDALSDVLEDRNSSKEPPPKENETAVPLKSNTPDQTPSIGTARCDAVAAPSLG